MAPKDWPERLPYLSAPLLSPRLTPEQRAAIHVSSRGDLPADAVLAGPARRTRIVTVTDSAHPACGQCALTAGEKLPPGSFVLAYAGYVHGAAETDASSDYDLSLDAELGLGVDAARMGNEGRFVNDYRGVAEGPNAEFRDVWVEGKDGGYVRAVGVFVLNAGKKGGKRALGVGKAEEILISYGKGFWKDRLSDAAEDDGHDGILGGEDAARGHVIAT